MGKVVFGEDGFYLYAVYLVDSREDSAYARELAVVVLETVYGAVDGLTGRSRGYEQKHLLAPYLALCVVAEDELIYRIELGGDYIYIVAVVDSGLRKIFGKESAEYLSAFKTDYSVDMGVGKVAAKFLGCFSRCLHAGLYCRHIHVVVYVRVVGGKVTRDNIDGDSAVFSRSDMLYTVFQF